MCVLHQGDKMFGRCKEIKCIFEPAILKTPGDVLYVWQCPECGQYYEVDKENKSEMSIWSRHWEKLTFHK